MTLLKRRSRYFHPRSSPGKTVAHIDPNPVHSCLLEDEVPEDGYTQARGVS